MLYQNNKNQPKKKYTIKNGIGNIILENKNDYEANQKFIQ